MTPAQQNNPEGDIARRLLATTFAEAPMGIAVATPEGCFLEANAAYCRMLGYTLEELRGLDLLTITHADDRAENRERISAALAHAPGALNWEKRYIRKDGEVVSVRGNVSVIRGEDGQPIHIVGIFEDLSERNAALEDLRRSQAMVEIAGRVAEVGGWSVDLPDRRLVWSDVVAAIHDRPAGFSPSLADGIDSFVPEHQAIMRAALERCVGAGMPYDLELEKITARGRRIWVRTIGQAERDARGRIVRVQGAIQEISSRKEKEKAAHELGERLRTTLESITDAFCTLDDDWCITYVNRHAEHLFGRAREGLLGRNLWSEFPQPAGSLFESELRRARASQTRVHFEEFNTRLHKWFAVTAYPSSQGMAVYIRDVTGARAGQQQLELLEASVSQLTDIVLITQAYPLDEPGPRILFVNEAFTRITGHARGDVLGKSPRLLQGPLTDRAELELIRAALSRFEPVHSELVNYTRAGEPYWIEMDIVPVGVEGDAHSHFVAVERDITERKRTQQVLLESEERLRLLHDLSDATRTLTDPVQIVAAMSRLLGVHLRASRCAYAEVDRGGERFTILHDYTDGCPGTTGSYEFSLFGARAVAILRSGEPLVIRSIDAELLPDAGAGMFNTIGTKAIVCCPVVKDGELRAMMAVHQTAPRDWTPRETAIVQEVVERCWAAIERGTGEARLRESEALLRIAGHTARLGGWAVDVQAGRVSWSDEVCAILEVPAATVPSLEAAFGFYAPQSIAAIGKAFGICADEGVPFDLELEMITAAGRPVWVRCTGEAQRNAASAITRVHGALQDITGQKRAEMDRERLAVILEATTDLVSICNPAGQLLFLNRAGRNALGVGLQEELAHTAIADFVSAPAGPSSLMEAIPEAVRQGVWSGETTLLSRLGKVTPVSQVILAHRSPDGTLESVSHVMRDITERKLAEAALRASIEEFRTLAEAMPQIVWIARPGGSNTYFNQQWSDYTGQTREKAAGHGWREALHPDDRQQAWDAWQHAVAAHHNFALESRLRRMDGVYRWWLARAVPLLDGAGNILKWIGTCTDIHEMKEAELRISDANDALRESERRFSGLLRTVQLLSVMLDSSGRITYCNDYMLGLTGWLRDEVIGRNWFELFLPHTGSVAADRFAAMLASAPDSWDRENEIVTRTGERRLVRWNNSILRSSAGEVIGAASIGEDITARRRDQLALRELNAELEHRVSARTAQLSQAREEADQANHAKSAFLATMSHEIRTPMNGVIGMIEALHQTSLKGQQVEMVDLIRDSAFSLLGIIEDILDFSKIEAGRMDIVDESMLLGEVIEKGCGMLARTATNRGVHMTMFVDPAIPRAVRGDEGRVRQVLVNLVGNAIKFSAGREQPGRVSVRVLLADRQAADVAVDLVVADDGIGMNQAALERLFTPFSQADASTTRRFGGTGLGLAISDMLVRLMNGTISVRSAPGQGSTFTVRLRFATLDAEAPPAGDAARTLVEGLQCRIIGTEWPLADDFAAYLRHGGAIVDHAPDLAAAAASVHPPGLSVWLIMPGLPRPSLGALRAMAPGGTGMETRFVILGFGARRHPLVEALDLLTMDADALTRQTLFQLLALAAGRVPQDAVRQDLDPQHHSGAVPPRDPSQGPLILVAEDNETNRKVILRQLHLVGFAAEVCVNGREALQRWRRGTFALVLTDLHMPEMDGYELAIAIRAEEGAQRHTPIIALTANALREEELRCRAAGMDAYLTKPVRLPQLKAAIEAWLGPAAP